MAGQYIEPMPAFETDRRRLRPMRRSPGHWLGLPRSCALCSRWSRAALCSECDARFLQGQPVRCPRCALPLGLAATCGACLREPPPFDRCIAAADYAFPWDRLIARFKFQDQPELARLLADALHRAIQCADAFAVHCVLPVPLSKARLAARGYNQAWELARRIAARQRLPAEAGWLQRLRDTPHQVGLSRAARQRNLQNAMWLTPDGVTGVAGRTVALVDDVLTTGVTAAAAAQALRRAGAASVQVWVLARTPAPGQ
jgi:ComF family protein